MPRSAGIATGSTTSPAMSSTASVTSSAAFPLVSWSSARQPAISATTNPVAMLTTVLITAAPAAVAAGTFRRRANSANAPTWKTGLHGR